MENLLVNTKAKTAIRQMVCNYYDCSDSNNNQYPSCGLKNLYPTCPFRKIEFVIERVVAIVKEEDKK